VHRINIGLGRHAKSEWGAASGGNLRTWRCSFAHSILLPRGSAALGSRGSCCHRPGHYLQADLAAFADGGVNGFLDHAIWVRCHSTPSRSFLEPPICPSLHNLSPQETPSLPYHSSTCASASSACGSGPALSTAVAMSRATAMTALINKLTSRPFVFFGMFHPSPREQAFAEAGGCRRKTWPRPSATTMMQFASIGWSRCLHPMRYQSRQVVTAERHLYGDRDPVLETIEVAELSRGPMVRIHLSPAASRTNFPYRPAAPAIEIEFALRTAGGYRRPDGSCAVGIRIFLRDNAS
jgi:hypothetical protein